ncbi:hypothetical protein RF11_05555 [Thelohanellus kitauei]|uniref:FLYWCH-type domain-containing protein n=1 Tax=Thelohanellus kitauei TaxID=669202 RepID=A0A0C2ND56_THEKT|nr:hypothetical protein RF11_05555 [Thelohanellus kitauei]
MANVVCDLKIDALNREQIYGSIPFWSSENENLLNHHVPDISNGIGKQEICFSKDARMEWINWEPKIDGKPIYVDHFIPNKDVLIGRSYVNKTIFYANRQLTILATKRYEGSYKFQSTFKDSYIKWLTSTDSSRVGLEKLHKVGNHIENLTDEQKKSLCDIMEEDCFRTIQRRDLHSFDILTAAEFDAIVLERFGRLALSGYPVIPVGHLQVCLVATCVYDYTKVLMKILNPRQGQTFSTVQANVGEQDLTIILTEKGKPQLIYYGHSYRINRRNERIDKIYWRCVRKECKAKLSTNLDCTLITDPPTEHAEAPNPNASDTYQSCYFSHSSELYIHAENNTKCSSKEFVSLPKSP